MFQTFPPEETPNTGTGLPENPLAVGHGGTGSATAAGARSNLGLLITPQDYTHFETQVNGSAGNIKWSMPAQGSAYKRVVIVLSGYTNVSSVDLTFPTAFSNTPSLTFNGTTLSISTLTTSKITIPVSTLQSGVLVIDGF